MHESSEIPFTDVEKIIKITYRIPQIISKSTSFYQLNLIVGQHEGLIGICIIFCFFSLRLPQLKPIQFAVSISRENIAQVQMDNRQGLLINSLRANATVYLCQWTMISHAKRPIR